MDGFASAFIFIDSHLLGSDDGTSSLAVNELPGGRHEIH